LAEGMKPVSGRAVVLILLGAGICMAQAPMGRPLPPPKAMGAAPGRPGVPAGQTALTPDEAKRFNDAVNHLPRKERKRLNKAVGKMSPAERRQFIVAVKRQLAAKNAAPQALQRGR